MNRRVFLRDATATAAVAGGAVWYSWHNGVLGGEEGSAYAAWDAKSPDHEPATLGLVRSAILASSPHNTQPWHFRVGASFLELYLERRRSVSGLDPYLREAHIGMGCALENLRLAAEAQGHRTHIWLQDGKLDGSSGPDFKLVARIDLEPGAAQDGELHRAIPHRHTNRNPYDPQQPLEAGFVDALGSTCATEDVSEDDIRLYLFEGSDQRSALSRVSAAANLELYSDPAVESGSQQWIRWRESEIEKYKDGLTIDNFGLPPLAAAAAKLAPMWLLRKMAAPAERSRMYESQMQSARLIGIIAVKDRLDVHSSLLAGRVWQRAHLLATARGVAARPCNEAVEMIDHERVLGREPLRLTLLNQITGDPAWAPTFLFLMGHPTRTAHLSPRRTAESVSST